MWDIIPISKAINYLHGNPLPHLLGQETATEADRKAYEQAIAFKVGSEEWCFAIRAYLW